MSKKEWVDLEKKTMKEYRKGLVHKARPMPIYNFFIPQPSSKILTSPKSPNIAKQKSRPEELKTPRVII